MARPLRGFVRFLVKIEPEQAKALRNATLRAKLDGLPEAGDGASRIVRDLIRAWIDSGAEWPAAAAPKSKRRKQ